MADRLETAIELLVRRATVFIPHFSRQWVLLLSGISKTSYPVNNEET